MQYQILIIELKETRASSQPFGESYFITEGVDSFSEIELMNLIKSFEPVFHYFLIMHCSTFWSHPFRLIFTRMLVFHYVLDPLVRIWRKLASLRFSRSFSHWSHFWLSYSWHVIRLQRWLCWLPLSSWFWHITRRFSFFVSELFPNHVFYRFWMLVFWTCIWYFSLTECISAFRHFALVICAVFRFNESPWFVLFLRPFHWFYSWHIIFHIQNLMSCIWSVQKWSLVAFFHPKKFLAFSFLIFIICRAWMDHFVLNSKFKTNILYRRLLGFEFWFKTWVILDVWFDRLVFFHNLFLLTFLIR